MDTGTEGARFDVIVIGAGQTGLAAGYHLARRGMDFVILEASARVGDSWRSRYDSLRLYSPARDDALPGLAFPAIGQRFPTGRQMGDYLEAYADHLGLPVHTSSRVDRLRPAGGGTAGYEVLTGSRVIRAPAVIVASGPFQRPLTPAMAGELDPAIRQLHSGEYRNPSQLVDGPALVVGASHSGTDIAVELAGTRRTYLSGRIHGQLPVSVDSRAGAVAWPILKFIGTNLLTLRTPIGRRVAAHARMGGAPLLRNRRPELRRAGVIHLEARTAGVRGGRPMLSDGQVLDVANVVWCTGYRPDHSWIEPSITGADGWPRQADGSVEGAPGLYVLGVPFLSGFTSILVLGASRDAARVVERIVESRARASSPAVAAVA